MNTELVIKGANTTMTEKNACTITLHEPNTTILSNSTSKYIIGFILIKLSYLWT